MSSLVLTLTVCGLCVCLAAGTSLMVPEPENLSTTTEGPTTTIMVDSAAEIGPGAWDAYKVEFKKSYVNSAEDEMRQKIFLDNLKEIMRHNAAYNRGEETYTKKLNDFSDMTKEEWYSVYVGK